MANGKRRTVKGGKAEGERQKANGGGQKEKAKGGRRKAIKEWLTAGRRRAKGGMKKRKAIGERRKDSDRQELLDSRRS